MRRRFAPVAVGLALVLAGCNHDGRSLAPERPTGTQSILPSSTVDPEQVAEGGDEETIPDAGLGADTLPGEDLEGDTGGFVEADDTMSIALPFGQDEQIPARFTCNGEDLSPTVEWFDVPEGTIEVAIELQDLQLPGYTHWVIAGLDPDPGRLEEGDVPVGAIQATNSEGGIGYTGPCPPPGETHTYLVQLSALDQAITLLDGADADALLQAIGAATIESVSQSATVSG